MLTLLISPLQYSRLVLYSFSSTTEWSVVPASSLSDLVLASSFIHEEQGENYSISG